MTEFFTELTGREMPVFIWNYFVNQGFVVFKVF